MTIEMLKALLEKIPKNGGINQARRRAVIAQMYAMMR